MLFARIANVNASTLKNDDGKKDSVLLAQCDSLQYVLNSLTKECTNLNRFITTEKSKCRYLNGKKTEYYCNLDSINRDSIIITLLQDSLTKLKQKGLAIQPYIKFAEQCAIRYANNKLYYPYDKSVEEAARLLKNIKDNPYPQLIDILGNYRKYYKEIIDAMRDVQRDFGVMSKNSSFTREYKSRILGDNAKSYINRTAYNADLHNTRNSIHYLEVLIKEYNRSVEDYKSHNKSINFKDFNDFGFLFNVE